MITHFDIITWRHQLMLPKLGVRPASTEVVSPEQMLELFSAWEECQELRQELCRELRTMLESNHG